MSFSDAVQWWEEWQLRLLALASLFLQYLLFAAALLRKRRIPRWFRALIWLAYQGGDVVAVYALATLFNRHKKEELASHPAGAHLDTLWAPILLLHLGGQDGITAYSIEDNEFWRRHFFIAASQITVAIYVFRKSWWSDDGRLLRAAILLFVPGIFKCLEKPWALKNATTTTIINSSDSRLEETILDEDDDPETVTGRKKVDSLEDYLKEAARCIDQPLEPSEDQLGDEPYHLFVDLSHPYSTRLKNLRLFAPPRDQTDDFYNDVHQVVRTSLSMAFDRFYTKHRASFGGLLRAAVVLLTFVDIGLFQRSHRDVYDRADVVVTYVLLCCTAALELVSACVVMGSGLPLPDDKVAQYNLVGYLDRNRKRRRLRGLAHRLGWKDNLDRHWCTAAPVGSREITRLVHDHVAGWWKGYINSSAPSVDSYRRFNDSRGQRTLEAMEGAAARRCSLIKSTLHVPFDESVVLWHLATEFCYFDHVDIDTDAIRHSKAISNYMAYLLFVRPHILAPGARHRLFRSAYRGLKKMLDDELLEEEDEVLVDPKKKAPPPRTQHEMMRRIIREVKSTIGSDDLVHRAWTMAHELMEFAKEKADKFTDDGKGTPVEQKKKEKLTEEEREKELMNRARVDGDKKMWEVIQGVWVEMLCFSAGRCRGYLHARSLGTGGEYLSYVWLLLNYMGMETLPERMQRTDLPVEGDTGGWVAEPLPGESDAAPTKQRTTTTRTDRTTDTTAQTVPVERQLRQAPATSATAAVLPISGDDNV